MSACNAMQSIRFRPPFHYTGAVPWSSSTSPAGGSAPYSLCAGKMWTSTPGRCSAATRTTRASREQQVPLHPLIVEHLKRLTGFTPELFPWNHHRRNLDEAWHAIQQQAVVKNAQGEELPLRLFCREEHEHTPACHLYGFHDLRRAFATLNAARLTPDQLQAIMQHQDYQTTQKYINMAPSLDGVTARLYVPELPKEETA